MGCIDRGDHIDRGVCVDRTGCISRGVYLLKGVFTFSSLVCRNHRAMSVITVTCVVKASSNKG